MRWEELERDLLATPGFQEEYDQLFPYEHVALEIAGLRGQREMTQTEFGELVGVPQSTIARLESGRQNPSVGMLKRIAQATGTELVIEFRSPGRKRRAGTDRRSATPSGEQAAPRRVAASHTDS